MAMEVIDGTIEAATLKSAGPKVAMYDNIVLRTEGGAERKLEKVAVSPALSAMVAPGTQGRFYGYKAIDHYGLFGGRIRGGRADFAIPTGNEKIMLMMTIVGFGACALLLLLGNRLGLVALVLGVLGAVGLIRYRRDRIAARARYDSDTNYS